MCPQQMSKICVWVITLLSSCGILSNIPQHISATHHIVHMSSNTTPCMPHTASLGSFSQGGGVVQRAGRTWMCYSHFWGNHTFHIQMSYGLSMPFCYNLFGGGSTCLWAMCQVKRTRFGATTYECALARVQPPQVVGNINHAHKSSILQVHHGCVNIFPHWPHSPRHFYPGAWLRYMKNMCG